MDNKVLQEARAMFPWLKEIFFQLHRNPELGKQEYKTQALVLAELKKMGITGQPIADTGVVRRSMAESPERPLHSEEIWMPFPFRKKQICPISPRFPV